LFSGRSKEFSNIGLILPSLTEDRIRRSEKRLRNLAHGLENQVRVRTHQLEQRNIEIFQQSEQLRELSNRLLQTQDDERRRFARELHDSAGQIVTVLGMNLASVAKTVGRSAKVSKAMQESRDLVQQLRREIRTLSYLLHPPLLDEDGLAGAIEWYIQGSSYLPGYFYRKENLRNHQNEYSRRYK
jgi:signal transduction histidine kinase